MDCLPELTAILYLDIYIGNSLNLFILFGMKVVINTEYCKRNQEEIKHVALLIKLGIFNKLIFRVLTILVLDFNYCKYFQKPVCTVYM